MRFALAAALVATTFASAPAAAQFYPPVFAQDRQAEREIGREIDRIYDTIEEARRARRFSEPEARALHTEGQRLFDEFDYLRRDGLDRWEYRELEDGVRALQARIDRRLRFGDWRDGRDDGYREARPWDHKDWRNTDRRDDDFGRRWPEDESGRDYETDDAWLEPEKGEDRADAPWRDEPVDYPDRRDERPAADGPSPGAADDDWWLPPEERESIESRPGDRAPGSGS